MFGIGLLLALSSRAQHRWYLGAEFGGGAAPAVTMSGKSNDRSSLCDEYINPQYANVPGCTDPNRGSGDGWKSNFASAAGLLGNLTVGYQVKPWFRVEVEHATWTVAYDDAVIVGSAKGVNQDKLNQEIFLARERLGTFTSSAGLFNVYLDHTLTERSMGLYVGAGVGLASTTAGYTSLWARNKNVDAIKTGSDEPNADEIKRNLAGTFSDAQAIMRSTTPIFHVMAGIDRHLSDRLAMGLKVRYAVHLDFDSEDLVWDPLRSHVPNIRLDGSEPVHGFMKTSDFSAMTVGLHVKHRF